MGRLRAKVSRTLSARTLAEKPVQVDPRQLAMELVAAIKAPPAPSKTISELAEEWLPRKTSGMASAKDFEGRIRTHLLPVLGGHTDRSILRQDVEEWVKGLAKKETRRGKPMSAQTIRHAWDGGRQLINDAIANSKWSGVNPFDGVTLPRAPESDREVLTFAEAADLLVAVPGLWRALFATAIYLGPRRGEMFALRKKDVNLADGYLSFRGSNEREWNKDWRRRLHIPIPDELHPFLAMAMDEMLRSEWLFPRENGERLTRDTKLCDVLRATLKAIGVAKDLTFHGLRRVSSSLHQEAGCHPWVVSKVLGHSQSSLAIPENMTASRYTQFSAEFVRQELNRLRLFAKQDSRDMLENPMGARSSDWIEQRPSKPVQESGPESGRPNPPEFLKKIEAVFWSKVRKTRGPGCWIWQGAHKGGTHRYGGFYVVGSRYIGAHRFAYELAVAPLKPGQVVMHTCDNPMCVRPAHLRAGTQNDNRQDAVRKHRQARGEKNGRAKLSASDVLEIRELWPTHGVAELARRYGVSQRAIRFAAEGGNWKHLKGAVT